MKNKFFKIILPALVIFIILGYVFYYLGRPSSEEPKLIIVSEIVEGESIDSGVGQQFLSILTTLRSVDLDLDFFQDEIFQGLTDYSVPLPQEESGRVNPFAPLGQ